MRVAIGIAIASGIGTAIATATGGGAPQPRNAEKEGNVPCVIGFVSRFSVFFVFLSVPSRCLCFHRLDVILVFCFPHPLLVFQPLDVILVILLSLCNPVCFPFQCG